MAQNRNAGGDNSPWLIVVGLCLIVAYCSSHRITEPSATAATGAAVALDSGSDEESGSKEGTEREGEHEDAADDGHIRGGETYAQYDARRDALDTGLYSGGDECTEDCGGHDAGRDWAERKGIADPDECGGKSWSFEEGCRSYAKEQRSNDDESGEE